MCLLAVFVYFMDVRRFTEMFLLDALGNGGMSAQCWLNLRLYVCFFLRDANGDGAHAES